VWRWRAPAAPHPQYRHARGRLKGGATARYSLRATLRLLAGVPA
jgi:hypothetical protein